jgi:molybdopterin-guanine dinucleotide biosynthesis protein
MREAEAKAEAKGRMVRAFSPSEVMAMKKRTLDFTDAWRDAFGTPEAIGVWFVWGNSGNGKTSFVMQLCRELTKFGKVLYNSLEEGTSLSIQNTLRRFRMTECRNRFQLLDCEPLDELGKRLAKRKSPDFIVIDSFQYTQMTYKQYLTFKEANRHKLIIFVSHAAGSMPSTRASKSVMYDASLKIWVEGYRALSKGRFIGETGVYTVWDEGARRYWGSD